MADQERLRAADSRLRSPKTLADLCAAADRLPPPPGKPAVGGSGLAQAMSLDEEPAPRRSRCSQPNPGCASPVPESNILSRLSAATLSDKVKLQVFLNGLRVVDLRQELKDRKYSFQGISKASKSQLVSHLAELLITGNPRAPTASPLPPSPKSVHTAQSVAAQGVNSISDDVGCVCGASTDDGSPMLLCSTFNKWSHLSCYGIAEATARKSTFKFKCCPCSGFVPIDLSISKQVSELQQKLECSTISTVSSHQGV